MAAKKPKYVTAEEAQLIATHVVEMKQRERDEALRRAQNFVAQVSVPDETKYVVQRYDGWGRVRDYFEGLGWLGRPKFTQHKSEAFRFNSYEDASNFAYLLDNRFGSSRFGVSEVKKSTVSEWR